MKPTRDTLDKFDALETRGREMVERQQVHGAAIESEFDRCRFDDWRREVNDLLFGLEGCDDLYYQRFSSDVTQPVMRDLEEGLRILAAAREDVAKEVGDASKAGASVSHH